MEKSLEDINGYLRAVFTFTSQSFQWIDEREKGSMLYDNSANLEVMI
jgi:hypothetical protein